MGEIEDWRSVELPAAGSLWRYQARSSVVQYKVLIRRQRQPCLIAQLQSPSKPKTLTQRRPLSKPPFLTPALFLTLRCLVLTLRYPWRKQLKTSCAPRKNYDFDSC